MFWLRNKKIIFLLRILYYRPGYQKVSIPNYRNNIYDRICKIAQSGSPELYHPGTIQPAQLQRLSGILTLVLLNLGLSFFFKTL